MTVIIHPNATIELTDLDLALALKEDFSKNPAN
jgi:hypothetical protein